MKLLSSAIVNMNELKEAFQKSMLAGDNDFFLQVVHRCKMTISFIKNIKLNEVINDAKVVLFNNDIIVTQVLKTRFSQIIDQVIYDLNHAMNN